MRTESEIQKDVMEELKWEAIINAIKPTEIGVAVRNGVVTLAGTVDTYSKKVAAEKATKRVAGVLAVANEIDVKLSDVLRKTDTEIAEAVVNSLKWNTSVPEDKIKVKVDNGWVTLDGEVEWEFQKKSVRNSIEDLVGVKGVTNLIKIRSKIASSGEVKEKINKAFRRNYYLDANKIRVQIENDKAILTGEVRTLAEKIAAETAAWSAPGINQIENKLEINYSEIFA